MKKNSYGLVALLVSLVAFVLIVGGVVKSYSGDAKVVVEGNYIEAASSFEGNLGSSSAVPDNRETIWTGTGVVDITNTKVKKCDWVYGTMPAVGVVTTTQYWKNETGKTLMIDRTQTWVQFAGTASSSVSLSMGTSTNTGIALYTTTAPAGIIAASTIATSTATLAQDRGLLTPDLATAGDKTLATLKNTESVIISWKQENNNCSGIFCEAVTSTARGYTASYGIQYCYYDLP